MKKLSKIFTATMAGLVGTILSGSPIKADETKTTPMMDTKAHKEMKKTEHKAMKAKVKAQKKQDKVENKIKDHHGCKGMNDCKGKGGCKTEAHACKGQNECKGKGGCNM